MDEEDIELLFESEIDDGRNYIWGRPVIEIDQNDENLARYGGPMPWPPLPCQKTNYPGLHFEKETLIQERILGLFFSKMEKIWIVRQLWALENWEKWVKECEKNDTDPKAHLTIYDTDRKLHDAIKDSIYPPDVEGDHIIKFRIEKNHSLYDKYGSSELPWQQEVSHLSIQYQIQKDEKKKREWIQNLDHNRIAIVREKKRREAAERDKAERRAAEAKNSWFGWLKSWTNMEYNHSNPNIIAPSGQSSTGFLVPYPSAGPPTGRASTGPDGESNFKKSRVSKRERMSTNYIWNASPAEQEAAENQQSSLWRNSLALSDGYNPEREFGRSEGLVLPKPKGNYSQWSFLMTKKQNNPVPNITDKFFIFLWKFTDVFIPLAGILAVFDWATDFYATFRLIGGENKTEASFGWIMFITVVILPNVHSVLSPNQDELLLWERLIRTVLRQPQQSPYDNWARPQFWIWIPTKLLYHAFAAFTHVYSQVKLHTAAAEKYENYMELDKRWVRFREMSHEQKFQYCDPMELVKLQALQLRANIYVVYYGIFSKSRLKFVMMEDALQYGTQLTMFVLTAFQKHVNSASVDYHEAGTLTSLLGLTHVALAHMWDFIWKILMMSSSAISLWLGVYTNERHQELLLTGKPPGFFRVLSTGIKTVCELLLPVIALICCLIFDRAHPNGYFDRFGVQIFQGHVVSDLDRSNFIIAANAFALALIYPFGYTFCANYASAVILNISNQGKMNWETTKRTIRMTSKFAFYQVCLTSKYNRIAPGDDQLTDFKFYIGPVQLVVFLISSAARLWFPVFIIYKYIPELPREPVNFQMHVLGTSAGIEYRIANLRDLDAQVLEYDYTKSWPDTLYFGSEAWEPKFYMLGPLYYIAMKLESKNEMNQIRNQFCERFNIQRINDEKKRPGVPTWICAVPQREKKVKKIFASDILQIDETETLWSLDCSNMDESDCSQSQCKEQQKAISQIATLVDISLMIETNEDPIIDAANKEELKEMFRSTMAIRYGISGQTKKWDFSSIENNAQSIMEASHWVPDKSITGDSVYGKECDAWRPLEERSSLQDNLETCFDECSQFQRWIKEEIESNNIYSSLAQYKVDGKNPLMPHHANSGINDLILDMGEENMIHSFKIALSDSGIMDTNPREYDEFSTIDNITMNWTPSIRMSTYVPSAEVAEWWTLYASVFPNSFHGSAGFGSPCIIPGMKGTSVCPTKPLEELDEFKEKKTLVNGTWEVERMDFKEMMTEYGWVSSTDEHFLPLDPHRTNEFIGFNRLEVELNRRYRGPEWKKEEFEKEVHKRMRVELQKQIEAKITMYIIIFLTTMVIATILSEMNLPIVPNLFRFQGTKINTLYKFIIPVILISFGVYLQMRMMTNNAPEYCRINPESHHDLFGPLFGSNCYSVEASAGQSMAKCGLGLRCFLNGKEIREIKDQSNPLTNLDCQRDFSKCGDYIKAGTIGILSVMDEMAQFKTENGKPPKLTCIFDHNMILNTPIGPNISPLRCPNILRDYFYRSKTEQLRLSLGFYTSEDKRTMVKEVWEHFKENVNSGDVRDNFKPASPDAMNMVQYDQYIYDLFFSDKNLDCVQIHGETDCTDDSDCSGTCGENGKCNDVDPKDIFASVGFDYSRMWNDEFESLKEDGWGWANKYFQDEEATTNHFNFETDFFEDIKQGYCDNKYLGDDSKSCELQTPQTMFDYVLYDRALFNLNTWPHMTITPRHGRQFCEAKFTKTKLYSNQTEFTEDAEKEYGHLSNALLMLSDHRNEGVYVYHQPFAKAITFLSDAEKFKYDGVQYAVNTTHENYTAYDIYGFDKVVDDEWPTAVDEGDDNDGDYSISVAEQWVNDALPYRTESKSYKGRWNKDMAVYNPSVPFYDMASRLDELLNQRTVHKPFVKQETDKHVLPFNENNAFPLFENKYGSGDFSTASYRSGPFQKIKFNDQDCSDDSDCDSGTCDMVDGKCFVESQYFTLLDEPIDLTNKAEVDEKCIPEKLFEEMGRRINQTEVYYKGIAKMDVNEYLTGLLPAEKDAHDTAPVFDQTKGPSLDYKMAQARRHMNIEPPYETDEYTLEEILADSDLYDSVSETLKSYEMDRASVSPIDDEAELLTDMPGATTFPPVPIIEMKKTKIDPFRVEGYSDSFVEYQKTETASAVLNKIRSLYKPLLFDRHFADNNIFNPKMLKEYRLANPLFPGNPTDHYGHTVFSDEDTTDSWQHRLQSLRDYMNYFGDEIDNNPTKNSHKNRNLNGIVFGKDRFYQSNPFIQDGKEGGVKADQGTNRTIHHFSPAITKTGPWQYAGNSYDFGFSKSKQRLREQVGDDFGKPLQNPRFHRRLLKECMQDPIKCRTFFRFKNKIGPFDDELGNGGLNKDYLAGMRAGSDGSDLNESPETFDLYSPFVGFDNCYDSSGQLNKADKRYFTPTKHDLTSDAFHAQFEETNPNHENPLWTEGDFGKDEPFYLRHALYALMNDAFFDVLNGTVDPGEYIIPQEMIDAGFLPPDSVDNEWRKKNAEQWFNWRHNDIDPLLDVFSDQMKLENNTLTEDETALEFSDFSAPEGWRKVLKPTDVFKMINSQLDIGGFDRTKVYPSGVANPSRWAVYYMLCPEGNKMSFDKSNFKTSSYTDENYPRTQTDKERIDNDKMVPIPSALVQIINSEDYRAKRKYLHDDIRSDLKDNKDALEAASDELFSVRKLPSWQRWKIDDDEFAVGYEAGQGHLGQGTSSTRKTLTQDEYHRTSEMFDQNIFGGWLIQPSWRESRSIAPPLSLYDPMWHQEFNESDLGVTEDERYKPERTRMYGQTRPYNLQELFEKQIVAFYNTTLKARRLDIHGNPCNDDATGDANCDRVEDYGFQNDNLNEQTHQQYSFDPTKITYWMKMARLQHFMDASKNDKYLTKVRKMGSKFNSLFGGPSKSYDQLTYKPVFGGGQPNKFGFTSEEGRDSLPPCPFGFNYNLMNPREFQSDGDWWMNSDPSITFNKQKMFNMYDPTSLQTYFGPKNINPYLKSEPEELLKKKEHYLSNPSMMNACIDMYLGTPIQDQTGAYVMTRKLEQNVLSPQYYKGDKKEDGGIITGIIDLDKDHKYMDDRERYGIPNDMFPNEMMDGPDDYSDKQWDKIIAAKENIWNQDWFDRNTPATTRRKRWVKWVTDSVGETWLADPNKRHYTMVADPWATTLKSDGFVYQEHQPSITNLHDIYWRDQFSTYMKKTPYESSEFSLNDIPYLIDQIPSLSEAPHLNKDGIAYSTWGQKEQEGVPFDHFGGYRVLPMKSPPSKTAVMIPLTTMHYGWGSDVPQAELLSRYSFYDLDPAPEWTKTRAQHGNELGEYLTAYNPLFIQENKDKLWKRKPTYLSHPVFAKNPEMLFPFYSVPWGAPVPTYSNGSLAFIDGGFEIDWENAKNFTIFADAFDTSDTFDQFPIPDYKWSDFYKKYFSGADDIEEHTQIIEDKKIAQKFMKDQDYFKTLAMGTSFRTPGFQPHDWLYSVSMESDLNGRFHDRQVGIRTDPALAQNSTIKCCDFQALDVHLDDFNQTFTPFIVDSKPYKALIPRMNNFRHGIMQQGVKWGPQYRYRTTRSPARCLHPMAFRYANTERGKCVSSDDNLIDPKRNLDYGPGAFIDGTKYIPLVNRDTFFAHDQHIGDVKIPDSPASIWDETRKSEYSQLYLDFAPYFQNVRTDVALEPCVNRTDGCDELTSNEYRFEPEKGASTEDIILDRELWVVPKWVLQRKHQFEYYGKRNIDLLDFFRHAFRPHIYTKEAGESDVKYEQKMSQMAAYLNSVDFSDGQARLNGYNPESFTELPTAEDFGPMPIQNPSIKYGYFQDGYTNLYLKYDLGNQTFTRGIINRLNEHQHTGDNYILPTALMGGNYGMLNTYMTDMSNIYNVENLQENAKSRLQTNPKALEWVGDPRSGTGYHRWFGRANNYDPWTNKWWFGRTNYNSPYYQILGGSYNRAQFDSYLMGQYFSDMPVVDPSQNPYVKVPRPMFTFGVPDSGPLPFWKTLVSFYGDLGYPTVPEESNVDKKSDKTKRYQMSYPSAAINGYVFNMQYNGVNARLRPTLWDRSLDKTGQIGESGVWEPVKWQSPGGHHLHTDYVGFKKEYTTEIQWEPDSTSLSTGHDYFLNRDLHFLHPDFNSGDRLTQMHIPTGDQFKKTIDSSDTSNIETVGTGENLDKPMFDFPPTRHPMLNFFNYFPNENTNEEWHPILEYMTETTLKRFSTMECVEFNDDGHYFSLASIDQLIQDANLQNWGDVSELVKTHPRKEDYIWYEKEMYHNLGIDHSAYEQDVKRWPYQDMWDRFTKDLPIEIAKKRKYKVNMLNWVLDETKPSAHVQHPWKSIHPHNVFHNARETFDMSYLGLNKWNRTSNLEQDPVFPYRRDFSIHVNENNIKNDFGYKESLGWLTTYLPEKISTGYDDVNLLCKKIKFPYYKNPNTDCDKDNADCDGAADDPIPTTSDDSDEDNDHKKVLISRATDLSELTFQDDFMIVGHESYERLADKLFFNVIENCRYHPQLPLDEIERQRVWLKYLADNDRTFPSWREPLIENDLSDYKKVIPKTLPICSRIKNKNDKTEWSYTFGMPESIQNKGCAPLDLTFIPNKNFDGPLRALNNEISYLTQNYKLGGEYFGGSPSDRTYPMAYSKAMTDPSISFHGCPVVHNGEMLIFGAGPDMKQYLQNMYRDYDDYADEASLEKRKCERKLGETIEQYFAENPPKYGQSIVKADTEYNRIFNYLLNYKNCEAEDLEYTNLYKATVKGATDGVQIEGMHEKFYATDFATEMKSNANPKTPKQIGYYKGKHPSSYDYKKLYNSRKAENDYDDMTAIKYPVFRWSYYFDYEEPSFTDPTENVDSHKLNFTTFDQNPIFNEFDSELPSNFEFKKRCWLPDKYLNDFAFDEAIEKYGLGADITRKMGDDDTTELTDEVLCPPVHPRFDHDWNFRFMKGEITQMPDLSVFNDLIERYFQKRLDARTLLGVWGRFDLGTADRPMPFERWEPVTWFLNKDGNNHQGHYTAAETILDKKIADRAGPKGDAVVTSAGIYPMKTGYQSERKNRPHPFKMFVLNNENYDKDFGVVVSPDTNVTTAYGKELEYSDQHVQEKINKQGFDPNFNETLFKTGLLEAFFEKNSGLEWPKGYMDSLAPEQRYSPIRMLFNQLSDNDQSQEVLDLNNFLGIFKGDNEMIFDRPLPNDWFVKDPSDSSPSPKAIQVSKLILGMIASEMLSTRSTYSPKRASDSLETPKFESVPRSRRSAADFENDSPSSTVDLNLYQADQDKVDERITDITDNLPAFDDFLEHIRDTWLTKPEIPVGDESDGERKDLDARNFENFLDSDVGDGLNLMMEHMNWNPSELGFDPVSDVDKRKEMTGELPVGNDFITKNWYDLNLFEKFGYLPDYKNDEKADAFSLFTKDKDLTQAFNVNTPNKIKNRKMRKIDEFYRDIYLPEQLMGVAEHPYYLDLSRCHDTNWYAGKPHCPNGPKLMEWFLSDGKNVPTKSYAFETDGDTSEYIETLANNFNEKHAELLNRLPLEHTYDEILMNPASKFLSQHDLYNTLMQNPQDGLQFDFTRQQSDRAVQKDNYRSERDGNKNHEFSAYLDSDESDGKIDLSKYLNTWQEFVHPDFDSQIDVRAEHPIIWSTNAVDHIRAVFEKANQATSQHRYLNLPTEGQTEMGGLNFTQMMLDWYEQDIKSDAKDARYVHQAETISDAKLNHLKNKFFILSMAENELSNDWWNSDTLTANEKTDTSKDGIKKQETDALQLLKRQYDHALISAIQNVQMQDAFSGLKLLSTQCNDNSLSDDEKPIMCHSDWASDASNPFKPEDYIKYMHDGPSYADIQAEFDGLDAGNDNYYASNDNKRAEMTDSNWELVTSEMDDLIFLEHGYKVKPLGPDQSADQIKFGDIFRPVFDNTIKIDQTDFLDQMLNLNKPCPILDGRVVLFGRIRKTQEIISHNANHQNAAEEKNSQLLNSRFSQDRTSKFKNDLRGGYTGLNNVHSPLDSETEYLDQFRLQHSKEYYNIEGENSIRKYLGMVSEPNDGRIQLGSFNNVHKSYPHPYTVVFSYDSHIDNDNETIDDIEYHGMVPNSISPQWGACVNFKKTESSAQSELICLGGMICYNGFKRNAGHHHSTYKYGRDDAFQCDNMDDAPHNMVISPKLEDDEFSWETWTGEWETSISSDDLFKMRLPIGLLGHTALVVPVDGTDSIHIFGGMFSKLSSFYGFKFSREGLNENEHRVDRYLHDAVADFTLVYDHTNGWTKGPELNSRRFGHSSFIYDADKKPMVYHVGGGQREGQAMNGIERWKIGENCEINYNIDQYGPDGQYGSNPYKNDPQLNQPYKWDGDAVFQSRLFFKDNEDLVTQLKRENSELDSNTVDFSQTDPNTQHIFGRAHPIKDWWLYTIPLTGKERQLSSIILDKFAPLNIDHSLKFFFDHGFTKTDRLFQEFDDQVTDCIDVKTNMTDDACWSTILTNDQMSAIWEEQYFDNDEIFMESPQNVTHSGIKYAPCRFCDSVSFEYAKNNLKLIQQTSTDPASITVNEPVFDNLNFDLGRMKETCSLEKVDLPGNQFNKATQVFDYLLGWNPVVFNIKMKSLQDSISIDETEYNDLLNQNIL